MNLSQAHVINEENVTNYITGIANNFANFFTQIRDLRNLAEQASTIMKEWAETMQDQAENVFDCEYSVLLGVDIGVHLPQPIGSAELRRLQSSSLSSQVLNHQSRGEGGMLMIYRVTCSKKPFLTT